MVISGSPARWLVAAAVAVLTAAIPTNIVFATSAPAGATESEVGEQTPSLQQLPIFGAQATPDPGGRGPGFPSIPVENVEFCTQNCGYLAEDGYGTGQGSPANSRIASVKSVADVEAVTGMASTWAPAYLSGDHPWGPVCLTDAFAPGVTDRCTNSWVNYRPDDRSELIAGYYPSIRYRVRFNVPSFPRDETGNPIEATMNVKMRVDNWGKVWVNGEPVDQVIWDNSGVSLDASAQFARSVKEGLNTIELVVGDGGGLAGFTFLIELSMYADDPLTEAPAGDADGDGTPDGEDAFPEDPNETTDSDGDGVGDNGDAFPNDATETTDTDGDGVGDNADAFPTDPFETRDSDGDGVGDNGDLYPQDPSAWANLQIAGQTTTVPARNGAQAFLSSGEASCTASSRNHGQYVSCMAKVLNGMKAQSLITDAEKDLLQSLAAQSSIGKK